MHRTKTVVRSDGGFLGPRAAGYPPHPSRAFYGITIPKVVWGRDTCLACRSRLPGLGCRVSAAASVVAFACGKGRHWRPATSVVASLREVSTGHPQLGRCFCASRRGRHRRPATSPPLERAFSLRRMFARFPSRRPFRFAAWLLASRRCRQSHRTNVRVHHTPFDAVCQEGRIGKSKSAQ